MFNKKQLYERAVELTESFGLAKETLALNDKGRPAQIGDSDVCALCMVGFINRAAIDVYGKPRHHWGDNESGTYLRAIGAQMVDVNWSDHPDTTLFQVRQRLQELAQAA